MIIYKKLKGKDILIYGDVGVSNLDNARHLDHDWFVRNKYKCILNRHGKLVESLKRRYGRQWVFYRPYNVYVYQKLPIGSVFSKPLPLP